MARKQKADSALDLVKQLINNEGAAPKRRGRPKGSKNKKVAPSTKKTAPIQAAKKNVGEPSTFSIQFVTQEEFEELGCPKFGYTTARIKQFERGSHGYQEVYLEYLRAAIIWSKLAKVIEWYSSTDEAHLTLCRKEIDAFKQENGLTKHDFFEVIAMAHEHEHKRKKMLKELRSLAKVIVGNRRAAVKTEAEKKAINFREVAKIPPNIKPALYHVQIKMAAIDEMIADSPQIQNEHACPEHLTYRGLRKPRNGCQTCYYFYQHNKKLGLKEKRNR